MLLEDGFKKLLVSTDLKILTYGTFFSVKIIIIKTKIDTLSSSGFAKKSFCSVLQTTLSLFSLSPLFSSPISLEEQSHVRHA